jgi:hypothetical protein
MAEKKLMMKTSHSSNSMRRISATATAPASPPRGQQGDGLLQGLQHLLLLRVRVAGCLPLFTRAILLIHVFAVVLGRACGQYVSRSLRPAQHGAHLDERATGVVASIAHYSTSR